MQTYNHATAKVIATIAVHWATSFIDANPPHWLQGTLFGHPEFAQQHR